MVGYRLVLRLRRTGKRAGAIAADGGHTVESRKLFRRSLQQFCTRFSRGSGREGLTGKLYWVKGSCKIKIDMFADLCFYISALPACVP